MFAGLANSVPRPHPGDGLPFASAQDYPVAMIQLPASYQEYLAGKSESFINTVRPVLMQSAAEKSHGVRILVLPHGHQAHLDASIPYGTVVEDID
jgi:hypothetical protein